MKYAKYDRVIEPDEIDKAYAAGFIDGEGCISICMVKKGKAPRSENDKVYSPRLSVVVGQDNLAPLEFIALRWGGAIYQTTEATGRVFFRLMIQSRSAVEICNDLLPYFKVKRANAENLILCQSSVISYDRRPRTEEQIKAQLAFVEESKRLNKREEV